MLNGPGVSGSFQADNGLTALVPGECHGPIDGAPSMVMWLRCP